MVFYLLIVIMKVNYFEKFKLFYSFKLHAQIFFHVKSVLVKI